MARRLIAGSAALALVGAIGLGGVRATAATVVYSDDFETATGWTANPNGTDTATGGRWERGDPKGTSALVPFQLNNTVSGLNGLITGPLAGYSVASHDVDDGITSIQSAPITLPSSGTLTLTFWWYFSHSNNSSTSDYFKVKIVGTTTTTLLQQQGTPMANRGATWTQATINITAHAGQPIRILFEAADLAEISLVEAAIDDLSITQS